MSTKLMVKLRGALDIGKDIRQDIAYKVCSDVGEIITGRIEKEKLHCGMRDFSKLSDEQRDRIAIGFANDVVNHFYDKGDQKQARDIADHLKMDWPHIDWEFKLPITKKEVAKTSIASLIR